MVIERVGQAAMAVQKQQQRNGMRVVARAALIVLPLVGLGACFEEGPPALEVVVYTSVDQNFAEPILKAFAEESGIEVKPVYDVEAAKTSGLVKRLIAEAGHPQADVFWNGEPLQTQVLETEGVLAPYRPKTVREGQMQDAQGHWTAFGGRARVFIVNTEKLASDNRPHSLFDLGAANWQAERTVIAYPLFGTSATQATALYAALGADAARSFYRNLAVKGVRIVDGNSVVRDLVAAGDADIGLTDTDDACGAAERGAPVAVLFPDQGADQMGTLIIPNTVALIKDGPNPKQGKAFIDYLLSEAVADKLGAAGWFHIDGRRVVAPADCGLPATVRSMTVDFGALARDMPGAMQDLRNLLVN